jgi:hypothetical protein
LKKERATKMGATAAMAKRRNPEENGDLRFNQSEFREFFDTQARETVGLSGDAALKRIRSGRAGSNLAWTELSLLSTLFHK